MNEKQKFNQIWGFRRNSDSSTDDSKSNSDLRKHQEKLSLVGNLVSPENDRVSETNDRQVEVEKKPKTARDGPKKEKNNKKAEKGKAVKSKPKKDSCASSNVKKVNANSRKKKKSKFMNQTTVSDDFRIFTESILDDLRVARETMFAKMRKEMDQLVNLKPSLQPTKKKLSGSNPVKKTNQKPRARKPTKPKQKNEFSTCKSLDHPQEQVISKNANDPSSKKPILNDFSAKNPILNDFSAKNPILNDSSAKNTILNGSSAKKPILIDSSPKIPIFSNTPDQLITSSSSYLTLPLVLPNSKSNDTCLTLERNSYSGLQSIGHNSTESSCVGNGYPVGLNHHQRFDNSNNFGIPNRSVQGFSHDGNVLGIRMMNGGGIRYNAGFAGHNTLPNHLGLNGFRSLYPN